MLEDHPSPEQILHFLTTGSATSEVRARIVRHLLAGCRSCRQVLAEASLSAKLMDSPLRKSSLESVAKPDFRARSTAAKGRRRRQLEGLADFPAVPPVPEFVAASLPWSSASPPLTAMTEWTSILEIVRASSDLRFRDSAGMLSLAQDAVRRADRISLSSEAYPGNLSDIRSWAWTNLANSLRIDARWDSAEEAFQAAHLYQRKGRFAHRLRPKLLQYESALKGSYGLAFEAVSLARDARSLYSTANDFFGELEAQMSEAVQEIYSQNPARARSILLSLIPLAEGGGQPILALIGHHNLVRCSIDLHRPEEGIDHLVRARRLYRRITEPLMLLRATWQEGGLLAQIGHQENAEAALARALTGFEVLGQAYLAKLVALELAEVQASRGGLEDALAVTLDALAFFETHGPTSMIAKARSLWLRLGGTDDPQPASP